MADPISVGGSTVTAIAPGGIPLDVPATSIPSETDTRRSNWGAVPANSAANNASVYGTAFNYGGMTPAELQADMERQMSAAQARMEAQMQDAKAQMAADTEKNKPPNIEEMKKKLADGTLTDEEAASMMKASPQDKLAMLESWGMKPKHTNKDREGADNLFNNVVDAMKKGPRTIKLRYAGSKFKLQIRKGSNGELTAAFERKKPGLFSFIKKAFKFVINPMNWIDMGGLVRKTVKSIGPTQ